MLLLRIYVFLVFSVGFRFDFMYRMYLKPFKASTVPYKISIGRSLSLRDRTDLPDDIEEAIESDDSSPLVPPFQATPLMAGL